MISHGYLVPRGWCGVVKDMICALMPLMFNDNKDKSLW